MGLSDTAAGVKRSGNADGFPFAAVIFDMDGVIVDTEWAYVQRNLDFAHDAGFKLSREESVAQVGQSAQEYRRALVGWFARSGRPMSEDDAVRVYEEWAGRHPVEFRALLNPGVVETVAALREASVRVALASSSPMANIREVLAACGLADAFEVVVSGEQFRESKPNPEIYLHTLGELGLPAGECCCVEDSVPGITAGKRAGLTVFAKREERFGFSQDAADAIIDQVPDLFEAARKLRG